MKTFLIIILILVIGFIAAVFGFKYLQSKQTTTSTTTTLQKTLVGVLQPVTSTGEYSHIIVVNGKVTGVTSTTVDLKPYENKKVQILGEYSGNTMYADSVTILP